MTRIVIVGGYGAFGALAAERLVRDKEFELIIAGRSEDQATAAAEQLAATRGTNVTGARIDATAIDLESLRALRPAVIINASGPFQAQDYSLARAAIAVGAHYVDLADARAFVTGIGVLNEEARNAGVLLTSGASSVPALASAIVDELTTGFSSIDSICHGISPGNNYDPGVATTASILGALGKPSRVLVGGRWRNRHGWQGLSSHQFPELGRRLMSHCDVPDLELFPERYAGVKTVAFTAGLEVSLFHLALWALSWPCRVGLLEKPERLAPALMAMKRHLHWLGSDRGGMFVTVAGRDERGEPVTREVHVIAGSDHGPYIPAAPSVILSRKLARGELHDFGAKPCLGLFTLSEFEQEIADLDIEFIHDRVVQL